MLKEVQMAPLLLFGIISRTASLAANRACKPSTSGKFDVDVQSFRVRIKLTTIDERQLYFPTGDN